MSEQMTPVIELHQASFGYGDRAVALDVDLTIRAGDAVGLLGVNGCGKSTLVKGILGINAHLGGEALLFGTPLGEFHERHRIGYVPQRHTLSTAAAATVREIVAVGRLPRHRLFTRFGARDRAVVAESLHLVGLDGLDQHEVSTLSGGQQRRVLIARALAAEPEVLVMDEPTAGVDAANQAALALVLQRLAQRGRTLVVVTHDVEPLLGVLHRGVVIDGGRIVFDGSIDALEGSQHHLIHPGHHHDGHHDHDDAPGEGGGREGGEARSRLGLDPLEIHSHHAPVPSHLRAPHAPQSPREASHG